MLGELVGLVGIILIFVVFVRAFLGTLGGGGRRRLGGGGSGFGVFFADLVVRLGTAVAIAVARILGTVTMSAVRFGKSRMERRAGLPSPPPSRGPSEPPEQPRERRERRRRDDPTGPDDLNPWGDDD